MTYKLDRMQVAIMMLVPVLVGAGPTIQKGNATKFDANSSLLAANARRRLPGSPHYASRRYHHTWPGGEEAFGLVRPLALKAIADAETFPKDEQLVLFEKVYWMQSAIERKAGIWNANWPCKYGMEPVINTQGGCDLEFAKHTASSRPAASCSWKWLCGLRQIQDPCVIYSFGSHGDSSFEEGVLQIRPTCEVHIFDPFMMPTEAVANKWGFQLHAYGLTGTDEVWKAGVDMCSKRSKCEKDVQMHKLDSIMRELGHDHIDILKIDIEGSEQVALLQMRGSGVLNHVSMINIELHGSVDITMLIDLLNEAGFRWWRKEPTIAIVVQAGEDRVSNEYAFIRHDWAPDKKHFA